MMYACDRSVCETPAGYMQERCKSPPWLKLHSLLASTHLSLMLGPEQVNFIRLTQIKKKCVHVCVCAQSRLTLRHHGLKPARLLCPWNFPGKNTGVGCHYLYCPINHSVQGQSLGLLDIFGTCTSETLLTLQNWGQDL